ncbi:DUF3500 domain-containing protein [Lentzea sp. NPDC058436]|uniref:DUF3500 domain-containing protein n=1 Tax=Lentzea sp. NPDC058436 TaxID=3346499 RepID=UPI003649F2E3
MTRAGKSRSLAAVPVLFLSACGLLPPSTPDTSPAAPPRASAPHGQAYPQLLARAGEFRALLSEQQRAQLHQPYTFENAARWHTYPQADLHEDGRLGLDLGTLSEQQWESLHVLLATAMGSAPNQGADQLRQHLIADDHLHSIGAGDAYGRGHFRLAFLGEPSETGLWQLQFGGHHTAVTNTYRDGRLIGATPSFRAIEPRAPFEYQGTTYEPEGEELRAFQAMLGSLTQNQKDAAELRSGHLLLGPGNDWKFPDRREGVPVASLDAGQRDLVIAAIRTYVGDVDDVSAAAIMAKYERELDATHIAWSGSTALNDTGDYVRIDGPSLWLELQLEGGWSTDEPHPHSVWRDRVTDYGGTRP